MKIYTEGMLLTMALAFGLAGWAVIELIIWLFSHISISWMW